jgi:hypothetical protein
MRIGMQRPHERSAELWGVQRYVRRRHAGVRSLGLRRLVQHGLHELLRGVRRHDERSGKLLGLWRAVRTVRDLCDESVLVSGGQGALRAGVRRSRVGPAELRGVRRSLRREHAGLQRSRVHADVHRRPHRLRGGVRRSQERSIALRGLHERLRERHLRAEQVRLLDWSDPLRKALCRYERRREELRLVRERLPSDDEVHGRQLQVTTRW